MPIASSLTPESRFMALFVGPKHTGKTTAACSWTRKGKRAHVDDFEGRLKGLLGSPWIDRDMIDYTYYEPKLTTRDAKPFFIRLNDAIEAFAFQQQSGRSPYSLYLCDSVSALVKNLLQDAIPLTHVQGRGNKIGTMNVADPRDYQFVSSNIDGYLTWLRSLPMDIIVTAHVIPKWGKPKDEYGNDMQYADSVQIGEKLSLTDKLAASIPPYFDHIFRFDREVVNREEKFYVEYVSNIACTSFFGLKPGRHDITGKNFKEYTMSLVSNNGNGKIDETNSGK